MDDISQFLDRHFAKPMFILALIFLFFVAGVLHFQYVGGDHMAKTGIAGAVSKVAKKAKNSIKKQIDKRKTELEKAEEKIAAAALEEEKLNDFFAHITSNARRYHPSEIMRDMCLRGTFYLYPIFILELLFVMWKKSPRWKQYLLYCLIPPFRLAGRDHTTGKSIWLPKTGWAAITPDLKDRVEKGFTMPMIVIALMVIPLLALEFIYGSKINSSPYLTTLVQMAAGLIWLAFTYEFIVMISIVEKKKLYCKEHWIDIAVILLPLIAFMRIARLGRLMRLQRTARLYRMRGMLMRTYRALILFNIIDRYILRKTPEKMLAGLKQKFMDKEEELNEIRESIQALEAQIELAATQAALEATESSEDSKKPEADSNSKVA